MVVLAIAMLIRPIGWSVYGLAAPFAGGMTIVYHLVAAGGTVLEGRGQA
jgi:hypothetical protein